MRARITAFLGITLLILVLSALSTSTVFAHDALESEAHVLVKPNLQVVAGESDLVRNFDGISFEIETSRLEPGHAFTVWIKVHEPDGTIVVFGGGGLSGDDGEGEFEGHLSTGPIPDADGETVDKQGDGNFDTPFTSKVTLVIRDHGPVIPGQVHDQTHSKNGGCLPGEPNFDYFDGAGTCKSIQQAVHAAPDTLDDDDDDDDDDD